MVRNKSIKTRVITSDKGFMLPSVLVISLLITTLLLGIVSIILFYNVYSIRLIKKKELDLACYSAIQLFMSEASEIAEAEKMITIDSTNVKLTPKMDGLFLRVKTTAFSKTDSASIIYYLGAKVRPPFENAIVISRPNLRATVSGKTKIVGNILGTSDKIKRGRISGKPTASNNYLTGSIVKETDIEVKYFEEKFTSALFKDSANTYSNYIDDSFELNAQTIQLLSKDVTNIINGDVIISGVIKEISSSYKQLSLFVIGEVIVEQETKSELDLNITCDSLTIESDVELQNTVIVVNNGIEINENSHFKNIQLFSKKNILINGSTFEYPTIIATYSETDDAVNLSNSVEIKSSIVNGVILLVNSTVGLKNNKTIIKIDNDSKIHGLVYSENNVNISGQVNGIIYTNNFWYYKEPTQYINWMVDLKIDRSKLDSNFLLPIGFGKENTLSILDEKWIN